MRAQPGDRSQSVGRLMGLGRTPDQAGTLGAVANAGFAQVPVIEYVTWTTSLPLSDADALATFPGTGGAIGKGVDILQTDSLPAGIQTVDTSFVRNGILQADLYVIGFGVHIFGEPITMMQIGNVLTPVTSLPSTPNSFATPVSPDVFTLKDVTSGTLGLASGTTLLPGILKWGHDSWMAAWHFANAFQFVWRFNQRQILVAELCADVCYFGPYADAVAAGTSEIDIQEYARRANDRNRAEGATGIFVPVNCRRIGSVNTGPTGSTGNTGCFHPTRDFDLAPTTYGGLRNQGAAGCCNPFRKLPCPTLLQKGVPIGMQLVAQDQTHYNQFIQHIQVSDVNATGSIGTETYDSGDTGVSTGTVAYTMNELTLDPGAANTFSGQQVTTSRTLVKGGTLKFAILIKGYEAWGPWVEYLAGGVDPSAKPGLQTI